MGEGRLQAGSSPLTPPPFPLSSLDPPPLLSGSAPAVGGVCPARLPLGNRVCEVRLCLASP